MIAPNGIVRGVSVAAAVGALVASCSVMQRFSGPEQRIFVSNYKDDTVSVLEGDPLREIKVIAVGDSPVGIAARSRPPLVAVANSTGARVTLIDPVRLEILRQVEVGEIPEHVAFSSDGKLLFVSMPKQKQVAMINPDTGIAGEPIGLERKPKRLVVSPDGRRLYVLLHAKEGGVAVVDIATRSLETIIPTGAFPTDFGLSRDGRRLVAASFDDDNVTVIDTEALKPIATWPVGTGLGLLVHPTKPIAYSLESFDDAVQVMNYETGVLVATVALGEFPTYGAITADGRFLYVADEDSDNISKFDTETNQRLERIAVGSDPANLAILGDK